MVDIHKSVSNLFQEHEDLLEIFECMDEFSDTQSFCDHYGYKIEDACNAILIKSKNQEGFYPLFCFFGVDRLNVNLKGRALLNCNSLIF